MRVIAAEANSAPVIPANLPLLTAAELVHVDRPGGSSEWRARFCPQQVVLWPLYPRVMVNSALRKPWPAR
jgi:hypothetical protein